MKIKSNVKVYADNGVELTQENKSKFVVLTGGVHMIGNINSSDINDIVGGGLSGRTVNNLKAEEVSIQTIQSLLSKIVDEKRFVFNMEILVSSFRHIGDLNNAINTMKTLYSKKVKDDEFHKYEDSIS
jgi:hypothetical protein